MSIPWHISLEALTPLKEKPTAVKPTLQKHYSTMNIHGIPCEEVQTGLMCELGAGYTSIEASYIQRLIASGLTIARLNLRNLEPDACTQLVQSVRQAVSNYSAELEYLYPLALIVDVRGSEIVTGDLTGGPKATVELVEDNAIRLTTDISCRSCGTAECLYIGCDELTDLQEGDAVFIDSLAPGKIRLQVVEIGNYTVDCRITAGGTIGSKMSVRLSKVPKERDPATKGDFNQSVSSSDDSQSFEHMEEQIAWAIGTDIDAVLIPDAQTVQDVKHVKDILGEKGKHILLFSCIETLSAFDNIDEIIAESDGIYLDRCVLATDLPVETIFIVQKTLLAKCQEAGKPCICKADINEQVPTLCVTDIANLIIDGCDVIALELQYDVPLKKITQRCDSLKMAERCIAAAAVICRQAERIIWQPRIYSNINITGVPLDDPIKSLCVSVVELSMRADAVCIICLTNSGRTAKILSWIKPYCPIVAVTRACHTARQLRFWRGCRSLHYFEIGKPSWSAETDARVSAGLDYCKAKRLVKADDPYVVLSGSRRGSGYCDNVRLLYATPKETVSVA